MVTKAEQHLRVGDSVMVPWGLDEQLPAEITEVWGDPPQQVRVALLLEDDEEPTYLLLSSSVVSLASG